MPVKTWGQEVLRRKEHGHSAEFETEEEEKEDMFESIFKKPVSQQRHKTQTPRNSAEDKRRKKGPLDYLNYDD